MSTWDAEKQLRWQYQQRIADVHLAHVRHLADRTCPVKHAAWQAAMRNHAQAFRAHRQALGIALSSKEPYPEDG